MLNLCQNRRHKKCGLVKYRDSTKRDFEPIPKAYADSPFTSRSVSYKSSEEKKSNLDNKTLRENQEALTNVGGLDLSQKKITLDDILKLKREEIKQRIITLNDKKPLTIKEKEQIISERIKSGGY